MTVTLDFLATRQILTILVVLALGALFGQIKFGPLRFSYRPVAASIVVRDSKTTSDVAKTKKKKKKRGFGFFGGLLVGLLCLVVVVVIVVFLMKRSRGSSD